MAHDIFISYAHVDDEPSIGAKKGWVTTFVEGLKKKLAQELGRRDAYRLWMDYELRGNDAVTPKIHEILDGAATLLLLLSKGYLASDWCREEMQRFIARVGPNSERVFIVALKPVDEMPDGIADLKSYEFWTLDDAGRPHMLADPVPDPTERSYFYLQEDLACDLASKILQLRPAEQPAPRKAPPAKQPAVAATSNDCVVFVEAADDDLDLAREIAGYLQELGFGFVLPLAALPGFDPNQVRPAELRRDRNRNMKDCDAVLMPFRAGPVSQVREHIGAWRTAAASCKTGVPGLCLFQENPDTRAVGVAYPGMSVLPLPGLRAEECARQFAEGYAPVEGSP